MRAVVGSVAVHAVLVCALVAGHREGTPHARGTAPAAITMVDAVEVDLVPPPPSPAGGAPAGVTAASSSHARATKAATRSIRAPEDPRGEIRIAHDDDDRADGLGVGGAASGTGRGGTGTGTGIGFGDGGRITRVDPPPPPPPLPQGDPPSKARPAKLIYPTRERDVEDASLFVARVIVDDEGYVVGAKLVRGFGGRRDEIASDLIWKFRYAPALDDLGRPIRSTLEQRYLVGP